MTIEAYKKALAELQFSVESFDRKSIITSSTKSVDTLKSAIEGLSGSAYKEALINALNQLKQELLSNPRMPYKGGM